MFLNCTEGLTSVPKQIKSKDEEVPGWQRIKTDTVIRQGPVDLTEEEGLLHQGLSSLPIHLSHS